MLGGRLGSSSIGSIDHGERISLPELLQPEGLTLSERRETLHQHVGILPYTKTTTEKETILVSWGYEWELPGHGSAYGHCGSIKTKGCLNVEAHIQNGLFDEMSGKAFIRRYKWSCLRAECPTCYESWAGKEAGKISYRLKAWKKGLVIHVIVSPSMQDVCTLSYEELRLKAYSVLKKSHFIGGSLIFHPFRQVESTKKWYFSPHFHALGYGWISRTKEGYQQHGWVVKNAGIRKTVSGTALYQLSHAGIHQKYHTITWFGRLSYNNLKVAPQQQEIERCPICGSRLRKLLYFGSEELPQEEGDYWLDFDGFMYKPKIFSGG